MPQLWRQLCVAALALIAGCTSSDQSPRASKANATAAELPNAVNSQQSVAASSPSTREQMLERFVGNWIVDQASPDPMEQGVNVWIRREGERLSIFEAGFREFDVRITAINEETGEISIIESLPESEVHLALKPLAKPSAPDSAKPDIEIVWGDGTRWILVGGHMPTDPEVKEWYDEMMAEIRKEGRRAYRVESGFHCYGELNVRYRLLCTDEKLGHMHLELMGKFISVSGKYPDSYRTYQAAIRNLDECANAVCLAQRYGQWMQYLDDNYSFEQSGIIAM